MFDVEMRGRQLCTAAHCTYAVRCGTGHSPPRERVVRRRARRAVRARSSSEAAVYYVD